MRQTDITEEKGLVSRAKGGDMDAFELLVRKFQQGIYRLCYNLTGTHQSADDMAQETFIKAYFSLPSFRDGMNFFTWIRKIAVNNSLNYLRAAKREEPLGERENRIPGSSSSSSYELPQDELQRNQIEREFRKALEALPSKLRAVFILKVYDNQSYREIAEILGVPEGTVMSRLNRARRKLKSSLAKHLSRSA